MSHFSVLSLTFQPHPTKKTSHKGSFCSVATFGYKVTTLSLQEGTDGVDLFHTTCPDLAPSRPPGQLEKEQQWQNNASLGNLRGICVTHTHCQAPTTHSTCINTLYLHQHTLPASTHSRLTGAPCVCVCVFVNTHCVSHLSACLPIIQMESLPAPEPFPKAFVIEDHCEHICWNVRSRCGPMTMCS